MKKLLAGSFALVLTLMLSASVFAASYDIKEYCGPNGLINRVEDQPTHYQKGDVLNVSTQAIVQNGGVTEPEQNLILSDGITINGNGATFDGGHYNGFIMVSSQGATVESSINNATLTDYGDQDWGQIIKITTLSDGSGRVRPTPVEGSYAKLTLTDVDIIGNHYTDYDEGNYDSLIFVGNDYNDSNTELNIISQNRDVNMSSTNIQVAGKLNFKGNNISVAGLWTVGKVTNDSNLTIGELIVDYYNNYMYYSAPMVGVRAQPAQEFIGEFTNNATITENGVLIVSGKYNNNGTINISSSVIVRGKGNEPVFNNNNKGTLNVVADGYYYDEEWDEEYYGVVVIKDSSTFNNDGIMNVVSTEGEWAINLSTYSIFNNNKQLNVSSGGAVVVGYNSEFNNSGTMTVNDKLSIESTSTFKNTNQLNVEWLNVESTSTFTNTGTIDVNEVEGNDYCSGVDVDNNSVFNNEGKMNVTGYMDIDSSIFNNNGTLVVNDNDDDYIEVYGGAIFNNNGKMTVNIELGVYDTSTTFTNNGVLKSTNVYIEDDAEFNNNNKWTADGTINIYEAVLNNNKGILNANQGFEGDGIINNYKDLNLGGDSSNFSGSLYVENGTVNLLKDAKYFGSSSLNTYNNGTLNAANGSMDNIDLSQLRIAKTMKLNFDVDLAEVAIDSFTFSNIEAYDPDQAEMASATNANQQEVNAKISLNEINLLTDAKSKVTVYEFGTNAEDYIEVASSQKQVLGPIFPYKVSYGEENKSTSNDNADDSGDNADSGDNLPFDPLQPGDTGGDSNLPFNPLQPAQDPTVGNDPTGTNDPTTGADAGSDEVTKTNLLQFERLGGGDGEVDLNSGDKIKGPLNPVLLQSKVVIAASSISQEEVFDTVLNNAGNYTFFQKQGSNAGDVEDRAAPTLWIKAFGSQEDVDMEDYTKVKTTYYGAVVGLDWDRQYTDNFDATYGIFASYIGGEFKDEDWSDSEGDFKVKQNGGYVGLRGNWYVGKLFINGIVDYGMLQNDADNPYKSDNFNSSVIGLAARVGYNFEVARRRFTIQPSVAATGKYILTDDFETALKNGTEIKEKIDDVTNITIEPGLKLALNLGKCWILSGEGKYVVENFSGDTKVTGEDLDFILPDVSYKNYANVGLGIEKIWGYTVLHLKGNKTFGGRDGIIVNAGIEFKF